MDGFPIHEVVGEVVASRHRSIGIGDRVVGWASGFDGLMEYVVADGDGLAPYDPALDAAACGRRCSRWPACCTPSSSCPKLEGPARRRDRSGLDRAAVLLCGQGCGRRRVTGVDPVDRDGVAKEFGVDTVVRATSDRWVSHLDPHDQPDIVIEAVGHQVATLGHAIEAAAFGGTVFYFGVADDDSYPISMRTMLRNNLTLKSGVTLDRRRMLAAANEFAREHPELLPAYVTHTFGVDEVQAAFELACRPVPERIKIAIVAMTHSRLQDALAAKAADLRRLGGRPDRHRPGGVRPGRLRLRRIRRPARLSRRRRRRPAAAQARARPIATAVRLPSADPAPIGRVLDAGADAVIIAMVESPSRRPPRSPRPATRPPGCAASGRCGPASASTPPRYEARASVFAMIETARGSPRSTRSARCPG